VLPYELFSFSENFKFAATPFNFLFLSFPISLSNTLSSMLSAAVFRHSCNILSRLPLSGMSLISCNNSSKFL